MSAWHLPPKPPVARLFLRIVLLAGVTMVMFAEPAAAQLISPGDLAAPHADLRGIRNCTRCHTVGRSGSLRGKCLECHTPVRTRIEARQGLHATFGAQECVDCHKDHFGSDFALVRFDTAAFQHDSAGFALVGKHAETGCRDCHTESLLVAPDMRAYAAEYGTAATTYLGLGSTCVACHTADDPHGTQFTDRACDECHDQADWDHLDGFDHNATRYRLTGRHRDVACDECHRPTASVPYAGMAFGACTDCHADQHDGAMGRGCTTCHETGGWDRINRAAFEDRFDHATTDFPLIGAHAKALCSRCHNARPVHDARLAITLVAATRNQAYPPPVATTCGSCHRDYHDGEFADTPGACGDCHGEVHWAPAAYDVERHNRLAEFALEGAHTATPCLACHEEAREGESVSWRVANQTCTDCHAAEDPHQQQFVEAACDRCHQTASFATQDFDHDATPYPLDGEHAGVPCAGCHPMETTADGTAFRRYTPIATDCRSCHEETR